MLRWTVQLGQQPNFDLLIVADAGVPHTQIAELRQIAMKSFRASKITVNAVPTVGWPPGPYSLFRALVDYVRVHDRRPFLIMEPDAMPTRRTWLEEIWSEYQHCGRKFMGHIYDGTKNFAGRKFMSGIAVYPSDTHELLPFRNTPVHWDVDGADVMVANGAHTELIRHFFGQVGLPPTFVEKLTPTSPENAMTLDDVGAAAVFHRDKDGSLMRILHRKLFPNVRLQPPITVVFPVCNRDIGLAIQHAVWLQRLGKWKHKAVIAFDQQTPIISVNQLRSLIAPCFDSVSTFIYHPTPIPGWPMAANWMFQNIAHHMAKGNSPWLLMEPDAVVLKADWIDRIQDEFERGGKPFMGPHVKGMQHCNGGMVYPPDTPARVPSAMSAVQLAWDYVMAPEMMKDCHNAAEIMQHIWTVQGDQALEVGGGEIPANLTVDRARKWIKPDAVVVHRIKDDSLIKLLLSGQFP